MNNKEELKKGLESLVAQLAGKVQAVEAVLADVQAVEAQGNKAVADIQNKLNGHKADMLVTDLSSAKDHLASVEELQRDIVLQTFLNTSQVEAKKKAILLSLEEGFTVYKEARQLFAEMDKEFVFHMSIATVEEDVALLNSLSGEINNAFGDLVRIMIKQGYVKTSSTSYHFPNIGQFHLGASNLLSKSNGFKSAVSTFKYEYSFIK
jgi:hypothetical protein